MSSILYKTVLLCCLITVINTRKLQGLADYGQQAQFSAKSVSSEETHYSHEETSDILEPLATADHSSVKGADGHIKETYIALEGSAQEHSGKEVAHREHDKDVAGSETGAHSKDNGISHNGDTKDVASSESNEHSKNDGISRNGDTMDVVDSDSDANYNSNGITHHGDTKDIVRSDSEELSNGKGIPYNGEVFRSESGEHSKGKGIDESVEDIVNQAHLEAERIKKLFIGNEIVDTKRTRDYRWTNSYEDLIYEALLEDDDHKSQYDDGRPAPTPTIRSCRGIVVDTPSQISFTMKERHVDVSRIELSIKLTPQLSFNLTTNSSISIVDADGQSTLKDIVPQRFADFLIFDITSWEDRVLNTTLHIGRYLQVRDGLGGGIDLHPLSWSQQPVLLVYENMGENPLVTRMERKRRDLRPDRRVFTPPGNGTPQPGCCTIYDWQIDMMVFEFDWYLFPQSFNARYCTGSCFYPLDDMHNATNYSFLKNAFHDATFYIHTLAIPDATCTPISYHPQSILFINSDQEHVLRQVPNMKVASCGCR